MGACTCRITGAAGEESQTILLQGGSIVDCFLPICCIMLFLPELVPRNVQSTGEIEEELLLIQQEAHLKLEVSSLTSCVAFRDHIVSTVGA